MKKSTLLYKKFILLLTLLLLIGGFSVEAWGANVAQTATTIANKGTSATGNGITFSLTGTHRIEPILKRYAYLKADEEFTLSWSGVPTGYTINVTQLKIRTYRENKKKTIGKYKTHKNTTYAVFTATETDENDRYLNSSSYFPLGNEGYITVRAEGDVLQYRDMTFTYTIGNNYSIRFNGNGSTSGSMSNLSMAYYIPKNLTANAFTRSYAISYDAGDGELDAEPTSANTASYIFEGWATTPGGTKAYNDGQSVQNLTDEVNEVVDLYAKWSGGGVTLPTGTRDGYFLAGWNKGGVRVGRPGETYYPEGGTSAITLVADWQENITPEFDGDGAEDVMKVGDTYTGFSFSNTSTSKPTNNSDDVFYYIIDNIDVNDHVEGCASGKEDSVISYNPSTNTLTALNAGTADITFYHKAVPASHVVASSTTFSITVEKYSNTISCNWDGWSKSDIRFDEEISTIISSTNSDGYASLTVTPTAGTNVARYDGANNKVVALYDEGTATWSISQAEDYKYYAAETKTLSLTVAKDPNCGCNIYTYAGTDNSTTVDNLDCNWTEVGVADSLFFQLKKRGAGRRCQLDVGYKDNGTTKYVGFKEYRAEDDDYYHEFKDDVHDNAIKLQFRQYYTSDPYIKDIRVTRKRWFNIKNAAGDAEITELSMPSRILTGDSTVATFKVDYSTCASTIKVASNNPHIVVAASDRSFSSTTHGERTITLKYSSTEVENITDAVVTIYTPYEHKTLTVNAETKGKLSTTIEYKGADSYAVDHANMSATDLFQVRDENGDLVASPTITLISNATGVINTISSNTAIDFICGGSATITASFAGVANMYEAASDLGQTITVNKLSDAISWSGVGDDGKIHVWADTDIPTSIASANSDIASYSVASANPYLSVTKEEEVYTLHAGIVGEVALTATSAGDCTYATASGSKTIAVDPREHAIIWDQDLEGIQTDDRGYIINRRITLNAYAVDNESNPTNVPVSYEITGGGTFATIENGNELVINVANLSGTLSTTITATTTVGTKYAIVSETKTISVVRWGTNTAKSADNTSDIVDGKIVINAPHATFTFSGATDITEFGYATVLGKPEGYKLAQSLDKNGGSKTYNFSWVSTNANCSIQVNTISFWIKAYDSDAFVSNKAKVSFDGAEEESVGTAAMTANDGDFKHFSKPENYTNRNVPVVCRVTGYENFDFYIKNISIEYTVYTTAPSATEDIEQVDRTINTSDKQTVDVRSLFSYATPAPSDFEYSYEIVGAPEHAFLEGGYLFWADAVGDYTVRAKVNMDEDHRESEWGSEKTIRVNKVPYVFNNSEEDQEWDTKNNWTISSWPIENLPTEDDDVIVRGHLTIDEEIVINSMTIDAGEGYIVEIAPTGGLTVGSGGVIGATKDNLKLKAGTSGVEKGQTGYLRISPDYAGAMPEATVELYSIGYYNKAERETQKAAWQFVGAPIADEGVAAKSVYTKSWIYSWDESTNNWVNNRATLTFSPFVGYETTQYKDASGLKLVYSGTLVSGVDIYALDLTYSSDGYNALANSFAAPIDISQFTALDFINAEPTISVLNTGTQEQSDNPGEDVNAPGKFLSIPVATATDLASSFGYPLVIPSMQGFFVQANSAGAKIKLDYNRLVWNADYSGLRENKPLRAPANTKDGQEELGSLKVTITANGWTDHTYLLESEKYADWYERGYDARKIMSEDMDIYTIIGDEKLSVNATNSIIGTRVGVRTSEETAYTLSFSHLKSESDMSLWDLEADQKIEINEGTTYTFFAEPNAEITDRFLIIERAGVPTNTTGVDDAEDEANVHKFIKDNQLYILKNGVLYNGTGARVK